MKKTIIITIICILIILLLNIIFLNDKPKISELEKDIKQSVKDVKTFYKFNITKDGTKYNKEQLIQYGGDCEQWSNYYVNIFKEKYNTKTSLIDMQNFNHMIAIISNKENYCIIDQINYKCYEVKNEI